MATENKQAEKVEIMVTTKWPKQTQSLKKDEAEDALVKTFGVKLDKLGGKVRGACGVMTTEVYAAWKCGKNKVSRTADLDEFKDCVEKHPTKRSTFIVDADKAEAFRDAVTRRMNEARAEIRAAIDACKGGYDGYMREVTEARGKLSAFTFPATLKDFIGECELVIESSDADVSKLTIGEIMGEGTAHKRIGKLSAYFAEAGMPELKEAFEEYCAATNRTISELRQKKEKRPEVKKEALAGALG